MMRNRTFISAHLILSTLVAASFAWRFGYTMRPVFAHAWLVAQWDLALVTLIGGLAAFSSRLAAGRLRMIYLGVLTLTCTLQVYLYVLNLVSNLSWGRTMSGHLVAAFAPTVWSGREPFPVGRVGITVFFVGTLVLVAVFFARWGPALAGPAEVQMSRR